jgi:hypothetical protein
MLLQPYPESFKTSETTTQRALNVFEKKPIIKQCFHIRFVYRKKRSDFDGSISAIRVVGDVSVQILYQPRYGQIYIYDRETVVLSFVKELYAVCVDNNYVRTQPKNISYAQKYKN